MKVETAEIDSLKPAHYNPRQISREELDKLSKSIKQFGFVDPALVRKADNMIVGGHQRIKAAQELGLKEVPVIYLDISENDAKLLNVALNKISGDWEEEKLALLLAELKFMDDIDELLTGFDDDELDKLLADLEEPKDGLTDDDAIPEDVEAICKGGQLWQLGDHRLLCGDATKKEDVERLMDGNKADLTLTDPPYNIGYEYNSYEDNKSDSEYLSFCGVFHQLSKSVSDKQIITTGKQNLGLWYQIADIKDLSIWYASNKMSGGRVSNLALCEPILFIGDFKRDSRATDYFEYNVKQQPDTGNHTCPKIIDLWLDLINCYSDKKVFDPFLGSGSTLIACEKTNRVCYGMEIDPHYCDITIKRWEDFTGNKAELLNAKV